MSALLWLLLWLFLVCSAKLRKYWSLNSHNLVGTSCVLEGVMSSLCVVVGRRLAVVHVVVARGCPRCSRDGGGFVPNDHLVIRRAEVFKTIVVGWYCCVTIFCRKIEYRRYEAAIFKWMSSMNWMARISKCYIVHVIDSLPRTICTFPLKYIVTYFIDHATKISDHFNTLNKIFQTAVTMSNVLKIKATAHENDKIKSRRAI